MFAFHRHFAALLFSSCLLALLFAFVATSHAGNDRPSTPPQAREGLLTPTVTASPTVSGTAIASSTTTRTPEGTSSATETPIESGTPTYTQTPTPPTECGLGWRVVPRVGIATMVSVSIASSRDVWAVGGREAQHWDGFTWRSSMISTTDDLMGVSAISSNDAWAVGGTSVLRWNGTAWSRVTLPTPTAVPAPSPYAYQDTAYWNGVLARSSTDVWLAGGWAGQYGSSCVTFKDCMAALAHWNGSSWTLMGFHGYYPPGAQPGGATLHFAHLDRLAYVGNNEVWAVGTYDYGPGPFDGYPMAVRCTGVTCVTTSPIRPGILTQLRDVSGTSGSDVWAVGNFGWPDPPVSLIEHYDGTSWSVMSAPTIGRLTGVTALTPNDVWAVGPEGFLHYDGTAWQLPAIMGAYDIEANGPNNIWAVGRELLHYPDMQRFTDVDPDNPFYTYIQALACRGIISGYSDSTFRWGNNTTRGQISKIVVLAEGWPIDTAGGPHFTDVPANDTFYAFIETAFNRGIISGYADGTFRPGNDATRGQLSKIIVQAEGWPIDTTGSPHFTDVPATNPFYQYIETAYNHGIISGYADNTFRWGNNATRGQISKIVYLATIRTLAR